RRVEVAYAAEHVAPELDRLLDAEERPRHQGREQVPFDELHREHHVVDRVDDELADLRDVLAVHAREEVRLSLEARRDLVVGLVPLSQALEGDASPRLAIAPVPHFGECPFADLAFGLVAAGDERARMKVCGRAHTPVPRRTTPIVRARTW